MKTIKKIKLYELIELITKCNAPERVIYGNRIWKYGNRFQNYYDNDGGSLFYYIFSIRRLKPFDIKIELIDEN